MNGMMLYSLFQLALLLPITSQLTYEESYVAVAAIDFGTTYSGYAFSFITEPSKIFMNKNWGANLGFASYKTPTSVLVNSRNEFVAFGYEAEDQYAEFEQKDDDKGYCDNEQIEGCSNTLHLYRHFKMMLHHEGKLTKTSTIRAIDGTVTQAMDIFVMSLRYLREHLIAEVSSQTSVRVDTSLFRWVITVPAIWRDEAKQFMREAAYQAGYMTTKDSKQLLIALEPEAASIFCKSLTVNEFAVGDKALFKTGTRYLVIDAGGGTIDLTAHEVLFSGKVKEIYRANGGDWGGTKVDANFVSLLKTLLSEEFIQQFQKQHPHNWLSFMVRFEKQKRATKPDGISKINIELPYDMITQFTETFGRPLDKAVMESSVKGVSFSSGRLKLKYEAVAPLFDNVIDEIVSHIVGLVTGPGPISNCDYFLLVGGFSESAFLQQALIDKFQSKAKILVPNEAQISVLKGAVLFGHAPDEIQARVIRKTYGIGVAPLFDPTAHHHDHMVIIEGIERCTNVFRVFVKSNTKVNIEDTVIKYYSPVHHQQKGITFQIYATEKSNVMYVDDEGVQKVGSFTVEMPNVEKDLNRRVKLDITFGGTEIQLHATDEESGSTAETLINFL